MNSYLRVTYLCIFTQKTEDHLNSAGNPPAPNPPIKTDERMKEKGLNESSPTPPPAPSEAQGLWKSQSQDKHIPATSKYKAATCLMTSDHHPVQSSSIRTFK